MTRFTKIVDLDTDQPLDELAADYAQKYRDKHPTSETSVIYRAMVRRFGVDRTTHAIDKIHRQTRSRIAKELNLGHHFRKGNHHEP